MDNHISLIIRRNSYLIKVFKFKYGGEFYVIQK